MATKTIDEITITKTTLDGTERFAGRDSSGDFKALTQAIADLVAAIPIGTIIPHDDTFPNTPALGAAWAACDGAVIATGVYTGYRARNLNGANVVLSLTWTADGGGSFATGTATDLTALNVGDTITGSGISTVDGQPAMVIDITGTVITINDTAASGAISSTFTNEGVYIGGGSGSAYDTLQNHWHSIWRNGGTGSTLAPNEFPNAINSDPQNPFLTVVAKGQLTNGVNGTPRPDNRTKPHTRFLRYVMKIS